jgi:large subunit ribosomal protein L10
MAKTKIQKQAMLAAYKARLKQATGVFVVRPKGLTPNEVSGFKRKLQGAGSTYGVVKNTIFALALEQSEMPKLDTLSFGEHAVVFINEDIANTAKLLQEFAKEQKDKVEILAGIIEGSSVTGEQVKDLANLPTKEQSIAMILGLLDQSIAGVANVLEDSVRSVAIIIDQAFKE